MKVRPIENKGELRFLILTLLGDMQDAFTMSDLIDVVFEKEAFNMFCSKEKLQEEVSEVIEAAWEANVIAHYPDFSEVQKYIVVT